MLDKKLGYGTEAIGQHRPAARQKLILLNLMHDWLD